MVLEAKADILKQLEEGRITSPESAILMDQIDPSLPVSTHLEAIRARIQNDWQRFVVDAPPSPDVPFKERLRFMEERFEFYTLLLGSKAFDIAHNVPQIPTFKNTHRESNKDLSRGVIELPHGRKIRAFKEWARGDDKRLPPTLLTIMTVDIGSGMRTYRPEIGPINWPLAVSIDIDPLNPGFGNTIERATMPDQHDQDLYHVVGEAYRNKSRLAVNVLQGVTEAQDYVTELEPLIARDFAAA